MGNPPAPRESQCGCRRGARRPYNDRRSVRPDERPRRYRPASRGTLLQAPADLHDCSERSTLMGRDTHPTDYAAIPRHCRSVPLLHRGWLLLGNIPLLSPSLYLCCHSLPDLDQGRLPRDRRVHLSHVLLSPILPHSAKSHANLRGVAALQEALACIPRYPAVRSTNRSTPEHRTRSHTPQDVLVDAPGSAHRLVGGHWTPQRPEIALQ